MKTKLLLIGALLLIAISLTIAQTNKLPAVRELMTSDEFKACGLSKLNDKELVALNEWVEKHSLRVAQAVSQKTSAVGGTTLSFDQMEGYSIVGDDGEFLGIISRNEVDSKSILNSVGRYGSTVSSTSIFCTVGRYGSEVSSLSAFSEIASTPPKIISKDGKCVAYLTKNSLKTPRVDPLALVGWLKSK